MRLFAQLVPSVIPSIFASIIEYYARYSDGGPADAAP